MIGGGGMVGGNHGEHTLCTNISMHDRCRILFFSPLFSLLFNLYNSIGHFYPTEREL